MRQVGVAWGKPAMLGIGQFFGNCHPAVMRRYGADAEQESGLDCDR